MLSLLLVAVLSPGGVLALDMLNNSFNIEIDLPETYKTVQSGEEIWFTTKVTNLACPDRIDITLNYDILNLNKFVVASKSETVAVGTQASFVGNLDIPSSLSGGNYFLRVSITPIASSINASKAEVSFKIVEEAAKSSVKREIYTLVGILFLIGVLVYIIRESKPWLEKIKLDNKIKRIVKKKLSGAK